MQHSFLLPECELCGCFPTVAFDILLLAVGVLKHFSIRFCVFFSSVAFYTLLTAVSFYLVCPAAHCTSHSVMHARCLLDLACCQLAIF